MTQCLSGIIGEGWSDGGVFKDRGDRYFKRKLWGWRHVKISMERTTSGQGEGRRNYFTTMLTHEYILYHTNNLITCLWNWPQVDIF